MTHKADTASQTSDQASPEALEDVDFDLLRWAVTKARDGQIRRLSTLRKLMEETFPGKEADIQRALTYWASYVHRQGLQAALAGRD